jgi:hypothetical protein
MPDQGSTNPSPPVPVHSTTAEPYPLTFTVDYPVRPLDRLTTAFRFLWIIPIAVIVGLVSAAEVSIGGSEAARGAEHAGFYLSMSGVSILFLPVLLMLVFRRKYPRWWFDWNLSLTRFMTRVGVYALLLRDEYPSTDEEQAVHLDFAYPEAQKLDRLLPIIKWFLAIPHWFLLFFLWIGAVACVVIAWFAILFTGRYPRSLFEYVVGVVRWTLRVEAYAFLLITATHSDRSSTPNPVPNRRSRTLRHGDRCPRGWYLPVPDVDQWLVRTRATPVLPRR